MNAASPRLNVLLISKRTDQALKLRDDLVKNPGYRVRFEETAEAAMSLITSGTMDCVVFNFETFGLGQVKIVQGVRDVSSIFQILVFTDTANEIATRAVKGMKGLIIIEKPLMNLDKDISGLCERLIGGEQVYQRQSKRHQTDQKAHIEHLATGKIYEGRLRDISRDGACIELSTGVLVSDDKLKITIILDELGRKRVVNAEVRWIKSQPGRGIAGVKFLKGKEEEVH